jgi:transporter family protein
MKSTLLWLPLALGSAVFAALVAVFGKLGVNGVNTTVATAVRAAVMFLTLVIIALATGKTSLAQFDGKAWLYIVLAGVAGALSWLCYFWALKVGRASHVAVIDRLSVVFIIVLAALFLGEDLTWKTGFGAALIALGAALSII